MAYATVAEVRALDVMYQSPSAYPDALVTEGIAVATQIIDFETGTSWEPKASVVTLDGNNGGFIDIGVLYISAITSVTVDGAAQTLTGWVGTPTGLVRRSTGTFTSSVVGRNVVVTVTAGATTTPPDDIKWACRTLARWHCLQAMSNSPSNVLQTVTDMGTVTHVQAGGPFNNPTALPDVNAVLRRRCRKVPGVG